jgi:hypothetical protein
MPIITTIRGNLRPFGKRFIPLLNSTGGTITTVGGYRIHTFTTVGNFNFTSSDSGTVDYLIVAGGGAGAGRHGGGGGAGGMLTGSTNVSAQSYNISVGAGGTGVTGVCIDPCGRAGGSGQNSVFNLLTAFGGGGGGSNAQSPANGGSGGGGGGQEANGFGLGTVGQGNNGAVGRPAPQYPGGGGGGAGSAGVAAVDSSSRAGNGGNGLSSSISGSSTFYSGGGGGGHWENGSPGFGGSGVGANGGQSAAANTGGGGGGGVLEAVSGNGGSGIVIIRYPI